MALIEKSTITYVVLLKSCCGRHYKCANTLIVVQNTTEKNKTEYIAVANHEIT